MFKTVKLTKTFYFSKIMFLLLKLYSSVSSTFKIPLKQSILKIVNCYSSLKFCPFAKYNNFDKMQMFVNVYRQK